MANWHYGDGAGGPHPTKNDWTGWFSNNLQQTRFESKTTTISDNEFKVDINLTRISLPQATTIGAGAFGEARLVDINIPKATTIGDRAFFYIVNEDSTVVTMNKKFDSAAEKDRIFGSRHWTHFAFKWINDGGTPATPVTVTWHYGDGAGGPHATKNDWAGTFKTTAKQTEFEAITTSVGYNQFKGETNLTAVSLPNALTIGDAAFIDVPLTLLNIPKCTSVEDGAFNHSRLTTLNLPECTKIADDAFTSSPLTSLNIPKCKYIRGGAFSSSKLTSLSLPLCIDIGGNAFHSSRLTTLDLPECTGVSYDAFHDSPLTSLNIPKCTFIGTRAFISIINAPTTHATMKSKYNTPTNKNFVFGEGHWDQITFTWIGDSTPPDTGGGTTPHPSTPTSITPDPAVAVTWHYGDGHGGPHATKNDWSGSFSSTAKQGEFEKITDHVDDHEFNAQEHLMAISLPQATKIGLYSFFISKMGAVNLPKVLSIGNNALYNTANNSQTKVTLPDLFDTDAEKNRIFGDHKWGHMSFTWLHNTLPANTIFWNGKIQDTQFEMDGKTVVKFIWNGKECVLKAPGISGIIGNFGDFEDYNVQLPSGTPTIYWSGSFLFKKKIIFCGASGSYANIINWMIGDVPGDGTVTNIRKLTIPFTSGYYLSISIRDGKAYFVERSGNFKIADVDDDLNFTNVKEIRISSPEYIMNSNWQDIAFIGNKALITNQSTPSLLAADVAADGSLSNFVLKKQDSWNDHGGSRKIIITGNKMLVCGYRSSDWWTADIDNDANITNQKLLDMTSKLTSDLNNWISVEPLGNGKVLAINGTTNKWMIGDGS